MEKTKPAERTKQKQKKGLWSPEEDEKLRSYILAHGHGCWSSVPIKAGLQRNGKSCRLRWLNYLRPGLRRGTFSSEEEDIILTCHSSLGNKWSEIAKYLLGRTDNEIKNYWHSHLKKRLHNSTQESKTPSSRRRISSSSSSTLSCATRNPETLSDLTISFQKHPEISSSQQSNSSNSIMTDQSHVLGGLGFAQMNSNLPTLFFSDWVSSSDPFDCSSTFKDSKNGHISILEGSVSNQEEIDRRFQHHDTMINNSNSSVHDITLSSQFQYEDGFLESAYCSSGDFFINSNVMYM